jgi:alanine-glyoxylate transaminase/serine-glyoxylate transaminase/serine-pyruvate transaminase
MGYWGDGAQRTYHHTAPINTLYGLHESLVMMLEEGLENLNLKPKKGDQLVAFFYVLRRWFIYLKYL